MKDSKSAKKKKGFFRKFYNRIEDTIGSLVSKDSKSAKNKKGFFRKF